VVWSGLLTVHEAGHAFGASRIDQRVERMTVGVGPRIWRGAVGETELELRLIPIVGFTKIAGGAGGLQPVGWPEWRRESATILSGVLATLGVAAALAALVGGGERITRRRWWLGRFVIADAFVLTVFNFLPVPPLDGGRALLGAVSAWRGGPLESSALFWIQLGGFALAVLPMALWTRWTGGIDRAAMRWGAPPKA
jgi:membrane-associated protease RseP (regulator of RpoE activity)